MVKELKKESVCDAHPTQSALIGVHRRLMISCQFPERLTASLRTGTVVKTKPISRTDRRGWGVRLGKQRQRPAVAEGRGSDDAKQSQFHCRRASGTRSSRAAVKRSCQRKPILLPSARLPAVGSRSLAGSFKPSTTEDSFQMVPSVRHKSICHKDMGQEAHPCTPEAILFRRDAHWPSAVTPKRPVLNQAASGTAIHRRL